jgi:TonB family protein
VLLPFQRVFAQIEGATETPQTGVVLVKLLPPTYPPLARVARVSGDVQIQLSIRRDGSVESTNVVSGHPLLKQAALESGQKSTFDCHNCRADGNSYGLTYSFRLRDDSVNCGKMEIDREWHVRSLKCLYLWKCTVLRTFRPIYTGPDFEVSQSQNRVTVIAGPGCIETESSRN